MARKSNTKWEVSKRLNDPTGKADYYGVKHYALRADGKLLSRYVTFNLDGKQRHDFRWKLHGTRNNETLTLKTLLDRGYHLDSNTPEAQAPERTRRRRRW